MFNELPSKGILPGFFSDSASRPMARDLGRDFSASAAMKITREPTLGADHTLSL